MSSLSPDDSAQLQILGRDVVLHGIGLICESAWWAGYAVLFCFAVYLQLLKGIRHPRRVLMLLITLILFANSTVLWSLQVVTYMKRARIRYIDFTELSLEERYDLSNDVVYPLFLPEEGLFLLNLMPQMLIGDSVVIWRAYNILGTYQRRLIILPLLFLLASFAFAVIDIICLYEAGWTVASSIPDGSRTCVWSEPLAWALSLFTNFVATCLIGIKFWQHRKFVKASLGPARRRTQVERVLALLIESGFLYCIFWLTQIILFINFPTALDGPNVLYLVLGSMGDQLSALYPTMIIVLVAMQRSIHDETTNGFNLGRTSIVTSEQTNTMSFAANRSAAPSHPYSSTDVESSMARVDVDDFSHPVWKVGMDK